MRCKHLKKEKAFNVYSPGIELIFADLDTTEMATATDSVVNLGIHPNPARDVIYYDGNEVISIFDASGHKIAEFQHQLDISRLPRGIYFLRTPRGMGRIVKE